MTERKAPPDLTARAWPYPDGPPPSDLRKAGEAMTARDCDEMLFCIAAILDEHQLNGETHAQMMRWKFHSLFKEDR